ncbi:MULTISPECIES: hypothetical protein, partial [Comamonas]|uniref:hypothetical protein n=1 Tax=Comamonas TaxID=283 RepID=UPI00237D8161
RPQRRRETKPYPHLEPYGSSQRVGQFEMEIAGQFCVEINRCIKNAFGPVFLCLLHGGHVCAVGKSIAAGTDLLVVEA